MNKPNKTISIRPAPRLVRAALAHCEIPLTFNDDYTVSIPDSPDFGSEGEMIIPEDHVLIKILAAVVTTAMVKHVEDTMILPSNVSRIREVRNELAEMSTVGMHLDDRDTLKDIMETLERVADNLDPEKR